MGELQAMPMLRLAVMLHPLVLVLALASRHRDQTNSAHFLNPDIAVGKTFHVAALQFDGTQRCYFIKVGSRIEQGSVMHAKGTNAECKATYRKEIALGSYDGTKDRGRQIRQEYRGGDSKY